MGSRRAVVILPPTRTVEDIRRRREELGCSLREAVASLEAEGKHGTRVITIPEGTSRPG